MPSAKRKIPESTKYRYSGEQKYWAISLFGVPMRPLGSSGTSSSGNRRTEGTVPLVWPGSQAFLQSARIDLDEACETARKKTAGDSGRAALVLMGSWREALRLTLDTST